MTVERVAGHPDYSQAGVNKNIPWIFSKKTIVKFYDASVIPAITNTDCDTEGIKAMGDKVVFDTVPDVDVKDYKKGQNVSFQNLESPAVELDINKAKYFAFKMDKIDIKQFTVKMMDKCAQDAGEQMKIKIDEGFFGDVYVDADTANKGDAAGRKSGSFNLGKTGAPVVLTKANVLDYLVDMGTVADEQNWPESDRWVVIAPWVAGMIKKSDLKDASMTGDGKSLLRNGRLGMIDRWTLYSSNLLTTVSDGGFNCYNMMFGHKSGICFASQLVETEFHEKLESTFGSGMKGLNVYGYKTLKKASVGVIYARKG